MKIYFRYQRKYFDGDTGDIVYSYAAGKGYVVEVTERTTYKEKKSKFDARFLYRKKDGTYLGSPSLTTAFLYEVAKDRYQTDRLVLTTRSCMVCFIGGRQEFYHFATEEEKVKHLEAFFQGMDYTEVRISSLIALVVPSKAKKIAAAVLPLAGIFLLVLAGSMEDEENILQPAPIVVPSTETRPSFEDVARDKIRKTQVFLSEFFRRTGKYVAYDAFFVSDVDFSSGVYRMGAMFPADGFRWNSRFFEKGFAVDTGKKIEGLQEKSVEECRKGIFSAGSRVVELSRLQERYSLSGEIDTEKLFYLLKDVYGCPVHIEGTITYRNLLKRNVSLDIWLYKLSGGRDDG